jgi:hypothetical protein
MIASNEELPPPAIPPNWDTLKEDLKCPLCDYNLRGLAEPRCPECGFQFTWQELLDAERDRHQYLFEDHPKRNIWSFWKTFWNDCRPRRFWRELSPAHRVNVNRLTIYWMLANGILVLALAVPLIKNGIEIVHSNSQWNRIFMPVAGGTGYQYRIGKSPNGAPRYMQISAGQYQRLVKPVWSWDFFRAVWAAGLSDSSTNTSVGEILAWPWLTVLSLLIFQASMRRAMIKPGHVLRCAIYGCDFTLLAIALLATISLLPRDYGRSIPYLLMIVFPIVATYRLAFAYKRYLRFSHPFLTVAASQIVVFLVMFDVLLNWTHWW